MKMSKDTYSGRNEVSLASISNAHKYLCFFLCRVILLFFGHSLQNCYCTKNWCGASMPIITHHPNIFHHLNRCHHHLNIPMTRILLDMSNLQRQYSLAAENVRSRSRQRSTIWFPVLVECWALLKPNICARNCKVMKWKSNVMKM